MITLQKYTIIAVLVILLGISIYEAHRASALQSEMQVLQAEKAAHAEQAQQSTRKPDDGECRTEGAEPDGIHADMGNSELLRLRGEVGALQRQLEDEQASQSSASNHIAFTEPYMPREAWSDRGTDKPLNTILTMFWALRQGDENKLEQIVSRVRDSQTLDELIYPKSDWENISAIQIVGIGGEVPIIDGKAQEIATAEVIVEEAPPVLGGYKALNMQRWSLIKVNDQWLITGCH